MDQPGGNENGSHSMFSRGSSVRFSSAVDDFKSPRRHLEAAINEERRSRQGRRWWAQQAAAAAEQLEEDQNEGGEEEERKKQPREYISICLENKPRGRREREIRKKNI
ncbi:hypothetical protein M0R45_011116 [Rubus argutus]|uniref:Uncharacterized protein n=1 Tax=Rubus argutus TaxID=59490 RepID=A0AAW1Y933_RUBAR